jgi:hypothetical protein
MAWYKLPENDTGFEVIDVTDDCITVASKAYFTNEDEIRIFIYVDRVRVLNNKNGKEKVFYFSELK